ncbi:MAG TPA: hypothetical protein VL326_27515 [Kofleriaceae bacterium]|nr:hypothetical protein [Kofleriaceae bacterium]
MSNEKTTKTDIPRTEPSGAASQQASQATNPFAHLAQFMPFAPFGAFAATDPMKAWEQTQQAWQKMFTDAQGQAQKWADEYATVEKQLFVRASQAIDTWSQLAKDSLAYTEQLSAQARKLGFDAARKSGFMGA